jgi:hypothetical protein
VGVAVGVGVGVPIGKGSPNIKCSPSATTLRPLSPAGRASVMVTL